MIGEEEEDKLTEREREYITKHRNYKCAYCKHCVQRAVWICDVRKYNDLVPTGCSKWEWNGMHPPS